MPGPEARGAASTVRLGLAAVKVREGTGRGGQDRQAPSGCGTKGISPLLAPGTVTWVSPGEAGRKERPDPPSVSSRSLVSSPHLLWAWLIPKPPKGGRAPASFQEEAAGATSLPISSPSPLTPHIHSGPAFQGRQSCSAHPSHQSASHPVHYPSRGAGDIFLLSLGCAAVLKAREWPNPRQEAPGGLKEEVGLPGQLGQPGYVLGSHNTWNSPGQGLNWS